jgi:hypothetical protein
MNHFGSLFIINLGSKLHYWDFMIAKRGRGPSYVRRWYKYEVFRLSFLPYLNTLGFCHKMSVLGKGGGEKLYKKAQFKLCEGY